MIFLGIDPGTATTGYAILENIEKDKAIIKTSSVKSIVSAPKIILHEASVISTPSSAEMPDRLKTLFNSLNIITKNFSPNAMVIERLFFNTNVKTAMTVGQARGVALLVASTKKMEVHEYTALEAKKVLTGYGRADKKEMQKAVMEFLNLEKVVKIDDANDAVAMIICHLHKGNILK